MSIYPKLMKQSIPAKWFVLVSRVDAQIFQKLPEGDFVSIREWKNPDAAKHERELVADKPGRGFSSASLKGQVRHSLDRHMQHHEHAAERFIREVAEYLEDAFLQRKFGDLILVAEPRVLGKLRKALPRTVKKVITEEIPHEYNGGPESDRKERLRKITGSESPRILSQQPG